jgi:hypothetical protein
MVVVWAWVWVSMCACTCVCVCVYVCVCMCVCVCVRARGVNVNRQMNSHDSEVQRERPVVVTRMHHRECVLLNQSCNDRWIRTVLCSVVQRALAVCIRDVCALGPRFQERQHRVRRAVRVLMVVVEEEEDNEEVADVV